MQAMRMPGAWRGIIARLPSIAWAVLITLMIGFLIRPAITPAIAVGPSRDLILATTTSTQDSGLLDFLLPVFEKDTGYRVKTIAVGSGLALALGQRGEADVLLVHSPEAEEAFVAAGFGQNRRAVMHNDFVICGPEADPAAVRSAGVAVEGLRRIAARRCLFVSRGDNSGTHVREQALWRAAGVNPAGSRWYLETGQGMGQSLAVAAERHAYILADRGTWLALRQNLGMVILLEEDPPLWNPYHVIEVNPLRWPKVNADAARAFSGFLVSEEGQQLIAGFDVAKYGRPLFVPDAGITRPQVGEPGGVDPGVAGPKAR